MKKLGYTMAHIWACPPSEGDDYIFHSHPPDQKIPKPKRLQEWYKKMLDKGIIERIVLDYKDIYKQALEDNIQSPAELPYFEGDFWPNVMEENIRELEQEEEVRKRVSKRQFFRFLSYYFSGHFRKLKRQRELQPPLRLRRKSLMMLARTARKLTKRSRRKRKR